MPLVLCHGVCADYLQCHLCMCEGLSPAFSHHWLITPILQMEDIYLIDICNYNYIRLCTRNQVTMLITHHSQGAFKVCSGWIWPPASASPAMERVSNWSNISICWFLLRVTDLILKAVSDLIWKTVIGSCMWSNLSHGNSSHEKIFKRLSFHVILCVTRCDFLPSYRRKMTHHIITSDGTF